MSIEQLMFEYTCYIGNFVVNLQVDMVRAHVCATIDVKLLKKIAEFIY